MKKLDQTGSGPFTVVLVILLIAVIGFAGWRIYDQNQNKAEDSSSQNETTQTPIEKAEDLDAEVEDLNSQDIDEKLNTSEIDETLQ